MILEKDSFKDMFIFETNDLIEQLENALIESESSGGFDMESINAVFRIMHTIKGSASIMDVQSIAELAHALEDLFDYLRSMDETVTDAKVTDIMLESLDFFKEEICKLSERRDLDGDSSGYVEKAKRMVRCVKGEEPPAMAKEEVLYVDGAITQEDLAKYDTDYGVTVYYDSDGETESLRAYMLIRDMEDIADDIVYIPSDIPDEECNETIKNNGFKVFFNSEETYEGLLKFFGRVVFIEKVILINREADNKVSGVRPDIIKEKEITSPEENWQEWLPDKQETAGEAESKKGDIEKSKHVKSGMINVNVEKLDELMDLIGELVISGMMMSRELQSEEVDEETYSRREALCYQNNKIIGDLHDAAMLMRMIPVSFTFQKMKRVVRDMCRKLERDVNFHLIGEETELDKNILESISESLLHMIRNAVDHGIGSPADRAASGKQEKGNITLEARNVGGDVWILVKDDGKGLNREKIYEKAYMKGLTAKPEGDMSDAEIFSYIFKPGFSTSENITEFSGRGVGLDVVNQNVSRIGGAVSVESTQGEGSTFIVKIPATLAIIGGMAFNVGKNKYSLPITSIRECLKVTEEELILDAKGNEAVIIRDICYPILRLHKHYNIETDVTKISDGILILIDTEYAKYCLFVDELIGEQQVVVKSLPKWIDKQIKGVSGCTLLGDGSISLILEAVSLIEWKQI